MPFLLHKQALSPASMGFVASLQEISELDLRIKPWGSDSLMLPQEDVNTKGAPAVVLTYTARPPSIHSSQDDMQWNRQVAINSELFEQRLLPLLQSSTSNFAGLSASSPMERMLRDVFNQRAGLPRDLQRALVGRKDEILTSAAAWVHNGGLWRKQAPSFLPRGGNEEATR